MYGEILHTELRNFAANAIWLYRCYHSFESVCRDSSAVDDLKALTPDLDALEHLQRPVTLARDLEALEHRRARSRSNEDWFVRAAREADLEVTDSDSASDSDEAAERSAKEREKRESRTLDAMRRELAGLVERLQRQEPSAAERLIPARYPGQKEAYRQLEAEQNSKKKKGKKGVKRERFDDDSQVEGERKKKGRKRAKKDAFSEETEKESRGGKKRAKKKGGQLVSSSSLQYLWFEIKFPWKWFAFYLFCLFLLMKWKEKYSFLDESEKNQSPVLALTWSKKLLVYGKKAKTWCPANKPQLRFVSRYTDVGRSYAIQALQNLFKLFGC